MYTESGLAEGGATRLIRVLKFKFKLKMREIWILCGETIEKLFFFQRKLMRSGCLTPLAPTLSQHEPHRCRLSFIVDALSQR